MDAPRTLWGAFADVDPLHGLQLVCHGYTVLVTDPDGSITDDGRQGLFDHDTRVLSLYRLLVDGLPPRIDSGGLLNPSLWLGRLTIPHRGGTARGPLLPQDALELTLLRRIGNGMREEIQVTNHSAVAAATTLTIGLDGDFCDVGEIASEHRLSIGRVERRWDASAQTLTLDYHAEANSRRLHRALRLSVIRSDSLAHADATQMHFELHLPARGNWRAELAYEFLIDDKWRSPIGDGSVLETRSRIGSQWRHDRMHIESDPPMFGEAIERAANDLLALRNWELDRAPNAWVPNAGLPSYTGLFGRDVLTAGWQSALIGPDIMRGAFAHLAATQARRDSAWHDAEPGKMVHEIRRGPLSELEIIPQRAYYGTQTAGSMFVVTLSELWHWTGEDDVLRTYLDAALRTFDWAERWGDRDRDGFLEYERRSSRGLKNQAWKDSDEAIRYPTGELVENPIATVEEQAYYCLALQRMAEMLLALGDDKRSREFLERSRRLRHAWHSAFWMPGEGFYAMALDPAKRQVSSIGSNPGHALAAGLVPLRHARQVADRLMASDLFSGWGIRTLSARHPSYNPLAYHLGTVWPVENATFALGFKRYGLDAHVERLVTAMFAAAERFRYMRLPEALGGHSRDDAAIPTVYPASNSPQAWSASATIQMAQTLLGIYPFAPAHAVALVRPALPQWLSSVRIRNLKVGKAKCSIDFRRRSDGTTSHRVFDKSDTLHVFEVAPPQEASTSRHTWHESVSAWLLEHAPGRVAAALRLALGDDAS